MLKSALFRTRKGKRLLAKLNYVADCNQPSPVMDVNPINFRELSEQCHARVSDDHHVMLFQNMLSCCHRPLIASAREGRVEAGLHMAARPANNAKDTLFLAAIEPKIAEHACSAREQMPYQLQHLGIHVPENYNQHQTSLQMSASWECGVKIFSKYSQRIVEGYAIQMLRTCACYFQVALGAAVQQASPLLDRATGQCLLLHKC
jgi:hypothetical protein